MLAYSLPLEGGGLGGGGKNILYYPVVLDDLAPLPPWGGGIKAETGLTRFCKRPFCSNMFSFYLKKSSGSDGPRVGEMVTARGVVPTPVFMPVGTYAAVKTLTPEELRTMGAGLILSNMYHLYLRPGAEAISRLGGLPLHALGRAHPHRFRRLSDLQPGAL